MPDESLKTALSYGSLCCSSKSLKYSWTVLNHCFVVWMDAFSAQEVSCCPWTGWSIVLLSKRHALLENHSIVSRDLKHCIVILKSPLLSSDTLKTQLC
ncbi:hypothetical protein TNCT_267041 [Trichonephila clavata]|uniref:Uncharacterized protein n=1 Tax=Trichonephila clavata TaxID=2740835 RepID=A0A8X6GB20_TRICU|nr:hypothetical protein TNCT_267041 [Trichonephila clavata]